MAKKRPGQNPKLLEAKELFRVALPKIMAEHGYGAADLTHLIPGLSYQSAYDWVNGNKVPDGPYTAWLIQVLRIEPAELFGPPGGDPDALVGISAPKGIRTQVKLLEERIKTLERVVEQRGAKVAVGTSG